MGVSGTLDISRLSAGLILVGEIVNIIKQCKKIMRITKEMVPSTRK
jgi:hypothetical protein